MAEIEFDILEVDLSKETCETIDVTDEIKRHIGGRGFGANLCWHKIPKGTDPLGPKNILYVGIGPVTPVFHSMTMFCFKSPLTSLHGRSAMGGYFGAEIAKAGYNAGILITGRAKSPVYLYVKDDDVQIRDASKYWGKDYWRQKFEYELTKELENETGQTFQIADISVAGERLVRWATIATIWYHSGSRLGSGTVMGSKNLKAIAVSGTKGPKIANPKEAWSLYNQYCKSSHGVEFKYGERRWGHMTSMPSRYHAGTEGVKNKQLGWHEVCALNNPVEYEQRYKVWRDGCYMCHASCRVPGFQRDGPWGPVVSEIRHDNYGGFNANTLTRGYNDAPPIVALDNELGLDGEDGGGIVAWAMELYDRGIITQRELGGIDLTWGNVPSILQLLKKIAYREGEIPRILGEGHKYAPKLLGRGSEKYCMGSKGVGITSYEPRGSMADAIGLAVSQIGAHHGNRGAPERVLFDSLTMCTFHLSTFKKVFESSTKGAALLLNAICGWNMTSDDVQMIQNRNFMLERSYSLREGEYVPRCDDTLPDRFFEETIFTKYGKPLVLERTKFLQERERRYKEWGLSNEGLPIRATLKELGLDFVIPELDPAGHVG